MIILRRLLDDEAETRKGICISFHPFSLDGEVPYLYQGLFEIWRFGKFVNILAVACCLQHVLETDEYFGLL